MTALPQPQSRRWCGWPCARFIEDLVAEQAGHGVGQYVILGAGLDTFAQRRPDLASRLRGFEIDRPAPQAWKRQRLIELGFGVPEWLRLVPVDFEAGESWRERLAAAGFEAGRPAVVASTGVSMYLTREANVATLSRDARSAIDQPPAGPGPGARRCRP
jgi:methyltransferase (TIGR00027 family)